MISDLIKDPVMHAIEVSRVDVQKVFDAFCGVYIEKEYLQSALGIEIVVPLGFKPEAVIVARCSPDSSVLEICWDDFKVGVIKINMRSRGKIALLVGRFGSSVARRVRV